MADDVDQAQTIAEDARNRALKAITPLPQIVGTPECVDCDVVIPDARRKANPAALRCIECQEAYEAGARHLKRFS
jgi:phage/conjugal plasmid C-4 type zinc finger TraR family protein